MEIKSTLIKFGERKNLQALQSRGELYLNNLPYFRNIEDEELRGDPNDGVDKLVHASKGTVKFTDKTGKAHVGQISNAVYREGPSSPESINLYCMYAMKSKKESYPIAERNFRFGNHALVLLNPQEFIDRTIEALSQRGIRFEADLVKYVENRYTGEMGYFRKQKIFEYQSEWRIVCKDGPEEELIFPIGDISEISQLLKVSEVNDFLDRNS